jgi:rare lipoprotein A
VTLRWLALVSALVLAVGCTTREARRSEEPTARSTGRIERGKATWYGAYHHGKPTASGERFDRYAMTAAHRTLRLQSRVRVTNLKNGRSVELRVNDRGPWGKDRSRVIDVSEAAARQLDMIKAGVVPVEIEVLHEPPPRPKKSRSRRRR